MQFQESSFQIKFIYDVNKAYPKLSKFLFHIPNGGKMGIRRGHFLKLMGVKAGVADVFYMLSNKQYKGLWLEFKSEKGRQADTQKEFESLCIESGYLYTLVRSNKEALDVFINYISN